MNPLNSLFSNANAAWRVLLDRNVREARSKESVRGDLPDVGGDTLSAVRQDAVPRVLRSPRQQDGFERLPDKRPEVWGTPAVSVASNAGQRAAMVATNLFRDGFEPARRSPVELSGAPRFASGSEPTSSGASLFGGSAESTSRVAFTASLDDLPQFG